MSSTVRTELATKLSNALTEWKAKHRLPEDDAVLLLCELFMIYQDAWDEFRRTEFPDLGEFREALSAAQQRLETTQAMLETLIQLQKATVPKPRPSSIPLSTAIWASIAALIAGACLGRGWLWI